ncbi:pseudouridine synthase [Calderihabitans maritimus]|uniref:Pseudouridine synthase n=1 Tax=Calderihabitans maritimus TaxID=1246530 RepID=A0A1Z5HNB5_9FIRM|nr:pseudouridine synthase [Calderihabitans maritimus]GAW91013.1 pseudouridine synthase [Calderihabitans maritimus]
MERLQKVLAKAGIASRRKSEELIKAGRVKVNGEVVTRLGTKVDPVADKIEVDGKPVPAGEPKIYIMLNKPRGYVTTVSDPQGRNTVMDLVKDVPQRIYPVGRLDYDTEGLLLLTNDGDLAYALTHPRHEVEKTYLALVQGHPGEKALERLRSGVLLEDGWTSPAKVRLLRREKGNTWLEIKIHEGRNRQVRRMCDAVGHRVLRLKRTAVADLYLGNLRVGRYRSLTTKEIRKLKEIEKKVLDKS